MRAPRKRGSDEDRAAYLIARKLASLAENTADTIAESIDSDSGNDTLSQHGAAAFYAEIQDLAELLPRAMEGTLWPAGAAGYIAEFSPDYWDGPAEPAAGEEAAKIAVEHWSETT